MELERSNVVPIGKKRRQTKRPVNVQTNDEQGQQPANEPNQEEPRKASFFARAGGVFRHVIFLVLLWLRTPLQWTIGLAGGIATLGLIIVLLFWWFSIEAHPVLPKAAGILAAVSFVSMTILWLYDSLLIKLSPEPIFFTQ
ncbi:hypothetical protein BKG02_004783 [Vibrio parahaemolyticus]|uniref:hypothetical protein n=1 Tax=Vibrio parahaemolyticus TaxID=670 RepID=UPI0028796963|nr:hypothetical protein [Vibrio parahaemolyticus]EJE4644430.1 hypothetical protein [Vibrio parahaemolyticus]MDS1925673.1 hypothetical protein [Vibrio parahaemolyticus]